MTRCPGSYTETFSPADHESGGPQQTCPVCHHRVPVGDLPGRDGLFSGHCTDGSAYEEKA
jgi:hypothetical protein